MEDREVQVIELDGKEYMMIDTINQYTFFVNMENKENVVVFTLKIIDGEETFEEVVNTKEAFALFYEKHQEFIQSI